MGTLLPDFLQLNGTPDLRAPRPPLPESQLPPIPHIPGTFEPSEDIHTECRVNEKYPPPSVSPQQKRAPGPRPKGYVNFPEPENGAAEIQAAIDVLGKANIHVPLPGGLMPTPNQEQDEEYLIQSPENQTFLRVLEKTGRVTQAAEIAGLSRSCFNGRKKRDKVFARLWQKALSYRAEMLEDEAVRRAVHGVTENIYYMGAVCGSKKVYSDSLLVRLLEGNIPEKYRQNHKIELEGKMAVATLILPTITSAEEWAAQNSGTVIDQAPGDEYALSD